MKALIIVAHPDDAELALGGTIAMLRIRGVEVTVAIATVSEKNLDIRKLRVAAAEKAAALLGHQLFWIASGKFDQVEEIPQCDLIGHIDNLVEETDPSIVFTHTEHDSHFDHIKLSTAVTASSRRWPSKTLYHFGPNEHRTQKVFEFVPNTYVVIDDFLDRKLEALRCYEYHSQGFRSLNYDAVQRRDRYYGERVGCIAAETLQLVSQVNFF